MSTKVLNNRWMSISNAALL